MGMRPEDFVLAEEGLEAIFGLVEPTGAEMHTVLDVGGNKVTAVFYGRPVLDEGDVIRLAMPTKKLHFFDGETGRRISLGS